jgi:PleD family two-component response regulator
VKIKIKARTLSAPRVLVRTRHLASAANIPSPLSCEEKNVVVVTSPNEKIAKINRELSFKGSITSVKTPVIVTRMLCPIEREMRLPFIS